MLAIRNVTRGTVTIRAHISCSRATHSSHKDTDMINACNDGMKPGGSLFVDANE